MTAEDIEQLIQIFDQGTLDPADINDYFDVIREAYEVHLDREKIRNGLWKEYPAEDQANQIKVKIDRVLRSLERMSEMAVGQERDDLKANAVEELYDIINYANFAVRIVNGLVP